MNRGSESPGQVVRKSFRIKSSSVPWLALHLHAVVPAGRTERAVLLLHGATLAGFIFDPPPPALSWQERLAERGWASYALDVRGFGRSTRPAPGDRDFDESRPFARAEEAVADVDDAIEFLRAECGHSDVALAGFSWGTILAGCFVAARPGAVTKLLLYAPVYATRNPAWIDMLGDPRNPEMFNPSFAAYRWTSADALRARWDSDIPVADKEAWRARDVLDAVLRTALDGDPLSSSRAPPAFRSPNGPFADLHRAFTGYPAFPASRIRVPVMIARGEGDTTSTEADVRRLMLDLGSQVHRSRTIIRGSHFALLERSAPLLFEAFEEFLQARLPG